MADSIPAEYSNELRALVRAEVIAAIAHFRSHSAATPASASPQESLKKALVLFTGAEMICPEFLAQAAALHRQGFCFDVCFSRSSTAANDPKEIMARLPDGSAQIDSRCERSLAAAAERADVLLMPSVSLNTAAKVALGIADSAPTTLLQQVLLRGKPVFVGRDISEMGRALAAQCSAAPPPMLRTAEDHFQVMRQVGVRFCIAANLAAEVAAAFHVERNETPERLAKQRPMPKREFVTAEDVWKAASQGQTELVYPADAIVTDQAREYAAGRGIALRPRE